MPGFDVIKVVSEGIRDQLEALLVTTNLNPAPEARIHALQTPPPTNPPLLTVFLYDVTEDATVRNRPATLTTAADGSVRSRRAPLPLVLRYMLTPWANEPEDAHVMLGCALQALWDSRTILGRTLSQSPSSAEIISVNLVQLSLEEKAKIWWAIQQPYQVSLNYDIRVVEIDPVDDSVTGARVRERRVGAALPVGGGS